MADFAEKTLVLYYYPKDSTPGCTTEANGFSASIEEFEKKNVTIIGVSGDNAKSHCNFIEKQGLKFKLATDEVTHLTPKFSRLGSLMCPPIFFWTENLICSSEIWLWKQAWHHCKGKTSNILDRKWQIQENLEKSHGQVSCKRCSRSSLDTFLSNQFSACNQNKLQLRSYKVRIEFEL